jgi:hypothetical protein
VQEHQPTAVGSYPRASSSMLSIGNAGSCDDGSCPQWPQQHDSVDSEPLAVLLDRETAAALLNSIAHLTTMGLWQWALPCPVHPAQVTPVRTGARGEDLEALQAVTMVGPRYAMWVMSWHAMLCGLNGFLDRIGYRLIVGIDSGTLHHVSTASRTGATGVKQSRNRRA